MPLTIINIFAIMEIIRLFRHLPKASYWNKVLQKTEVISLVNCFISFAITGTIYFLAIIMAENLFSVLGMKFVALEIIWRAFYLIEKLKKINLCQRFSVGEGEQK